jgi:hypothetical protein
MKIKRWTRASLFPIIQKIGGEDVAFEIVRSVTGVTTKEALGAWGSRKQIPGDAMIALMKHCDALGLAYRSEDFIVTDNARQEHGIAGMGEAPQQALTPAPSGPDISRWIGAGRGLHLTPRDAAQYIRDERAKWD